MRFEVYNDPGHGWVKVPKALLVKLGIADKISSYSYERGEFAYLEEDCDASAFCLAAKAAGLELKFHHNYADRSSKVRGYSSYRKES